MSKTHPAQGKSGFLKRLARDQRAATMPLMAAAMIPLAGFVGGAVDMGRIYLAKARLQQACDAGALAGRRRMGGGQWNQASFAPKTVAERFFDTNFRDGAYGTADLERTFTEAGGRVTGEASVAVPMTLMKALNAEWEEFELEVACDAEMRLPNTDIMFVLDVTGSMSGPVPGSGDSEAKMVSLRRAVKCFYEIVARLDTSEVCTTGAPSGGTTADTQIRFGFVPYATNVNVGRLLPTSFFADRWKYQTRKAETRDVTTVEFPSENGTPGQTSSSQTNRVEGSWTNVSTTDNVSNCDGRVPPNATPQAMNTESGRLGGGSSTSGTSRTTTWYTEQNYRIRYEYRGSWQSRTGGRRPGTCTVDRREVTYTLRRNYSRTDTGREVRTPVFDQWHYAQHEVDISPLKNGSSWNTSFEFPIGNTNDGAATINNKTIRWDGCIEERKTIRASSYTSEKGGAAKDLDIDTVPTSGDADSLWGPALADLIYMRPSTRGTIDANDAETFALAEARSKENYSQIDNNNEDSYFCPAQSRRLQAWSSASTYENYVDSLTPNGNTYHDIGLIWGARLISPDGIFASANASTPQGGEIERHLIFMTDGETCTGTYNYGPYGFPWYDRRQTDPSTAPTDSGSPCDTTRGTLTAQVNARFSAVCTAVKNKNITLWVIYFGTTDAATVQRMTNCATSGRFFNARNSAQLQTTFASIANQISQLRLTN